MEPLAVLKLMRVPWRNVDGLLCAIPLTDCLRKQLLELGVNPSAPEENLLADTWLRVVAAVRRALYPDLSREEADFKLGYAYFGGLGQQPFGEVLTEHLRGMGPEGMLRTLAGQTKVVRPDMQIEIQPVNERSWKYVATDSLGLAHFAAGTMQAAMDLVVPSGRVALTRVTGHGYELTFNW